MLTNQPSDSPWDHHGTMVQTLTLSEMLLTRQTRPGHFRWTKRKCARSVQELLWKLQWEYHHKIWPYMLQYLHFRILKWPLKTCFFASMINLESLKSDSHRNRLLALQSWSSTASHSLWESSCPFDKVRHLVASCRTRRPLSNAKRSPRCAAPLPGPFMDDFPANETSI